MSMEYIRKTYKVPAKRGGRVRYTGDHNGKVARCGTIKSAIGGYLKILIDGEKTARTFHPTWEIEYL